MQYMLLTGLLVLIHGQAPEPTSPPVQKQERPLPAPTQGGQTITSPLTDGQWTVLSAEKNGVAMDEGKSKTATARDNVITWTHDGKQCSMRLHFGQHQRVFATEMTMGGEIASRSEARGINEPQDAPKADSAPKTEPGAGIFIATNDVVCICLHEVRANQDRNPAARREPTAPGEQQKIVLILKKGSGS